MIKNKRKKFNQKVERMKERLTVNGALLTDERRQILSYPILDLVSKLRQGDLYPVPVLEAYQVALQYFLS